MNTATCIVGIFPTDAIALKAAERALEVAGRNSTIRVYAPGVSPKAVSETTVLQDHSDWIKVGALGSTLGLVAAIAAFAISGSWTFGLVGLATGILTGLMLGVWLIGQSFTRPLRRTLYRRYQRLVQSGRAMVAVVTAGDRAQQVRETLVDAGGTINDLNLH